MDRGDGGDERGDGWMVESGRRSVKRAMQINSGQEDEQRRVEGRRVWDPDGKVFWQATTNWPATETANDDPSGPARKQS